MFYSSITCIDIIGLNKSCLAGLIKICEDMSRMNIYSLQLFTTEKKGVLVIGTTPYISPPDSNLGLLASLFEKLVYLKMCFLFLSRRALQMPDIWMGEA